MNLETELESVRRELAEARADQAAIVIENARLLAEVGKRTHDLEESLAQQTAAADVLKVISRSAFDLDAVLQTLIDTAVRLTRGSRGTIFIREGDALVASAFHSNVPQSLRAYLAATSWRLDGDSHMARAVRERAVVHVPDLSKSEIESDRQVKERASFGAGLWTPLMRQGEAIGVFGVPRDEPIAYSEREIELIQTFADQAVIAIENARLFNATQEALERQTATAEILKVIANAPGDAAQALRSISQTTQRLFRASSVTVLVADGDNWGLTIRVGASSEQINAAIPVAHLAISLRFMPGVVYLENRQVHVPDVDDPAAITRWPGIAPARAAGTRTLSGTPLRHEGRAVGALIVHRDRLAPFTADQLQLLQLFADQAAVAVLNARLINKTRESLERQTATADILKVIARTPDDVQPVFEMIVERAMRLLNGFSAIVVRHDGELMHFGAAHGGLSDSDSSVRGLYPRRPGPETVVGNCILQRRPINIADIETESSIGASRDLARSRGWRSALAVPMLRDGRPIGAITVAREQAGAFAADDIALLQTFADQAVIAIENVRLFSETNEALQQQTATADVLKVISRSAFDLPAVLDTLVSSAGQLCAADGGIIWLRKGELFHAGSTFGVSPQQRAFFQANPRSIHDKSLAPRVMRSGRTEHIPDRSLDPEFSFPGEAPSGMPDSMLGVPLLRDGRVEGVFTLFRLRTAPFAPRQIELVETFADQAVIAIENARLFDEVQARTRELTDALDRQKATAEILRVISSSPTNVKPVFDVIVLTAARLFGCQMAVVFRVEGDKLRPVTAARPERLLFDTELTPPMPIDPDANFPSRAVISRQTLHVPDYFAPGAPEQQRYVRDRYGVASGLFLPLLRADECVGVFVLAAAKAGNFGEKEIALAESFRDQALIAIENTRLFNETQEALQQQTATADVLKVISRSAFDLQSVFNTLISSAIKLIGAGHGTICLRDGDVYRYRAYDGLTKDLAGWLAEHPATPGRGSAVSRAILSGKVEVIADVLEDKEFLVPANTFNRTRSILAAPLLREGKVEGALIVARTEPGAFTKRQVELVETFADQAVIAIENARLIEQVRARTRELTASLDDLRKTQDRLVQSEKLASLGQLTAGIAHEIKNPLNFVNNFSTLSRELLGEVREVLAPAALDPQARADLDELIGLLDSNLDKVAHHGKRADSIVKNMLLHSREGSGERARTHVNAMVEEALNLGYHGARAEKPGFNVTIEKSLDPQAGDADLYLQEITRVLLNLIANGFYATARRKENAGADYQPTLTASTRSLGERVEIRIRDNGTGIPDEVRAKMFNPFFTTKPAGEGTGLGLSLSHDIVVKQHGGGLDVETEPDAFTEFVITLPRRGVGI